MEMNRIILYVTHWQVTENWTYILEELKKYGNVFCLIDEKQENTIQWITYKKYKNKWYDFWKIHQFLFSYKWKIDELVYTNDTISIIDSFYSLFDWWNKSWLDMWWATSAYSADLFTNYWYHLQSFFHFFRWEAIERLKSRYITVWIIEDKFKWVKMYETWLTSYMQDRGIKCWAYIEIDDMSNKYWWERVDTNKYATTWVKQYKRYWELSWTFEYPREYLVEWLPFVKNSCFQYHMYNPNLLPELCNKVYEKLK